MTRYNTDYKEWYCSMCKKGSNPVIYHFGEIELYSSRRWLCPKCMFNDGHIKVLQENGDIEELFR